MIETEGGYDSLIFRIIHSSHINAINNDLVVAYFHLKEEKMKEYKDLLKAKTLILTHGDSDGICSGAIVKSQRGTARWR